MLIGKFRHLLVVENGEVLTLLVSLSVFEKGKTNATTIFEGVEKYRGSTNFDKYCIFVFMLSSLIYNVSIPKNVFVSLIINL